MRLRKISEGLFHLSNEVIRGLFFLLIFLTLAFALCSNLWLLDARSTNWLTNLMLAIIVGGLGAAVYFPRFRKGLSTIFVRYRWVTAALCLIVALVWQVQFVALVHPAIGFDVGAIHDALTDPTAAELRGYFSENYNNLPLLLVLHQVAVYAHSTSWLTMAMTTTLVNDLAALFILLTVAVINWRQMPAATYIVAAWLAAFPMVMVPYTDVWVLLPVAVTLFGWSVANRSDWFVLVRIVGALLAGVSLALAAWIKPSTAVLGIAIVLGWLVFALHRPKLKTTVLAVALAIAMVVSFGPTWRHLQSVSNHQTYIRVDPSRRIPMIHFINVGMTHDGAYDPKAALKMAELPTKKARVNYSKRQIKKRLAKRGSLGYVAFLVKKQGLNTANGNFGWLHEGHFIRSNQPHGGWRGQLANFVYPHGRYLGAYNFISQLTWTALLFFIAFGWESGGLGPQTLRLGIIGGMLFLLLFEGGRSRYLIQFLPMFLILASLTAPRAVRKLKRIFQAVFGKAPDREADHG